MVQRNLEQTREIDFGVKQIDVVRALVECAGFTEKLFYRPFYGI